MYQGLAVRSCSAGLGIRHKFSKRQVALASVQGELEVVKKGATKNQLEGEQTIKVELQNYGSDVFGDEVTKRNLCKIHLYASF